MKSAGKARSNGLYRHIRTSKEIIRNLLNYSYENLTNYRPVAVTCNSYAECKDCKIGGFCGGGCQLSHQIDFKKCCTYEEEVFSHFMKTLFIPYIKSKYNEVNQNERKAENRCT